MKGSNLKENRISPGIEICVDYSDDFNEMIKSLGQIIVSDNRIDSKHFPCPPQYCGKKIKILAQTFYFGFDMDEKRTNNKILEFGFRPANLIELLYFQTFNPRSFGGEILVAGNAIWRDGLSNRFIAGLRPEDTNAVCGSSFNCDFISGEKQKNKIVSKLFLSNYFHNYQSNWSILGIKRLE